MHLQVSRDALSCESQNGPQPIYLWASRDVLTGCPGCEAQNGPQRVVWKLFHCNAQANFRSWKLEQSKSILGSALPDVYSTLSDVGWWLHRLCYCLQHLLPGVHLLVLLPTTPRNQTRIGCLRLHLGLYRDCRLHCLGDRGGSGTKQLEWCRAADCQVVFLCTSLLVVSAYTARVFGRGRLRFDFHI